MIPFAPITTESTLINRIQDVVRASFRLCVSGGELVDAIFGIFTAAQPGSKVLTFGADAPDSIQTLTPTRYLQVVESDGKVTTLAGWR